MLGVGGVDCIGGVAGGVDGAAIVVGCVWCGDVGAVVAALAVVVAAAEAVSLRSCRNSCSC